jgi:hypothetical protein
VDSGPQRRMTSTKGRPPTPKELYTAASNPQPLLVIVRDARSYSYATLHALKSMGFNLDRAKAPQSSSQQSPGERFGRLNSYIVHMAWQRGGQDGLFGVGWYKDSRNVFWVSVAT